MTAECPKFAVAMAFEDRALDRGRADEKTKVVEPVHLPAFIVAQADNSVSAVPPNPISTSFAAPEPSSTQLQTPDETSAKARRVMELKREGGKGQYHPKKIRKHPKPTPPGQPIPVCDVSYVRRTIWTKDSNGI